jgi:hypothetical protein
MNYPKLLGFLTTMIVGNSVLASNNGSTFVQNTNLFPSNSTVIDFSLHQSIERSSDPVQIMYAPVAQDENIVLTTNATLSFSFSSYSLLDNGHWGFGRQGYVGLEGLQNLPQGVSAYAEFKFNDGPVSSVGAFMDYSIQLPKTVPEGGETMISTLDINGNVLDTYDIPALAPISTIGQTDGGAFRGIVHNTNDISAVVFSNSYLVLDNLTFGRVPEPSSWILLTIGLAIVGQHHRCKSSARNRQTLERN